MKEAEVKREDLETWAGILLDHSIDGVKPGERIMIKGERIAWPLMEVLERRVIEAGGLPDVYLVPPNNERGRVWSSNMGRAGKPEQFEAAPDWHQARYNAMDKYIEVLGAEDPGRYADLTADQSGALAKADRPFSNIRLSKPWVITLYPTNGFADTEGMSLANYTDFIVRASTVDPRPLLTAEEKLAPLFESAGPVRIVTHCPHEKRDLTLQMDLSPGRPMLSCGKHNFPDGEIYTSPDANTPEGEIFIDLPVHYGGRDIRGIYLKLESGRITSYRADEGQDQLAAIIETDEGSHRLGEMALGMNPGLDRVLKHPLFVEKVGGTLHIAIGASYEDCYVTQPGTEESKGIIAGLEASGKLNRSAQHVDIVADFRPGGCGRSVRFGDRQVVIRDNVWVPA